MTYYDVSKIFWLLAAPTSALVLISAIAALWALLGSSKSGAWLAAAAACGLVIAGFTPIGLALMMPLESRFALSPRDSHAAPDGIIVLAGAHIEGIEAAQALSRNYPEARIIFSGFQAEPALKAFARVGGDPARVYVESRPRTTFEDARYSAALLKPKPGERWLLVTIALYMPRAVGCFRAAGFEVEAHQIRFRTGSLSDYFAFHVTGPISFFQLDAAAREWIGLIAYRLMGKTDALFPAPSPAPSAPGARSGPVHE